MDQPAHRHDALPSNSGAQPAAADGAMHLCVAGIEVLTSDIRQFRLRAENGADLPAFAAGAHVKVAVTLADGQEDWREYSLISFSGDPLPGQAPREYLIAVRREEKGRGGSAFMHERLKPGDRIRVQPPRNDFALHAHPGASVLVAGGIGVTPLLSMAAQRVACGEAVRMVYAGRSLAQLAYRQQLQSLLGDRLSLHSDEHAGHVLDVTALLAGCAADDHLYVCGPKPMLDGVLAAAQVAGWPAGHIHFEVFAPAAPLSGDRPFELVLGQSGRTLTVPADKSVLDVLIAAGCDPMFDCMRGECGVCAVPVLEGEIDHRDYVLSAFEKKSGQVMQTCVSRCKGPRLVLDL